MPRQLALFPLDMVLFPGTRAPLHIFEDRYRALLADITATDGRFGLLPPGPDGEAPPSGTIGTVARVRTQQLLPDGRSNILVEGESRFVLRRLLDEDTPYLNGLVEEFGDEEGAREIPPDAEAELRELAERCRRAMAVLADLSGELDWSEDPGILTFQVAGTIPWDTEQSRPLLAMRSAAERAGLLLRLLPGMVPDLEGRAAVHRRAGSNGHGRHAPGETG